MKVQVYSIDTPNGKRYGVKDIETGKDPWGGHKSARWSGPKGAAVHAKRCGFEICDSQ